jgi:pyrroline-5-carboxylate reductase
MTISIVSKNLGTIDLSKIAFLGLGNMANKMINRIADFNKNNGLIHGYSPGQRKVRHVLTHASIDEALNRPLKYLFYAFKPKNWDIKQKQAINFALQNTNYKRPIIVSVLAGLGIEELNCDIATMPNILCEVGHSFMFAHANDSLSESDRNEFTKLCENMGSVFWVNKSQEMHMAVACSGSAPAYFLFAMDKVIKMFELSGMSHKEAREKIINKIKYISDYFNKKIYSEKLIVWDECHAELSIYPDNILMLRVIEAYCNAMHKLGLDMRTTYLVAWHTILGTALYVEKHNTIELETMMHGIMSKGGTTEQAISVARRATFDIFSSQNSLNDFFFSMLNAAYNHSIFLKKESKKL